MYSISPTYSADIFSFIFELHRWACAALKKMA